MGVSATPDLAIRRVSGVRSLDDAQWRRLALADRDFYASPKWLAAQEEFSGRPQHMLVAVENDEVVAVMPYSAPDHEFNQYYEPRALWGDGAPAASGLLHLGVGRGYYNRVLMTGAQGGERTAVTVALAAESDRLARETGRSVVAQYLREEEVDEVVTLLGGGAVTVVPVALNAVIRLTGGNFDDYLNGFGARKSRRGQIRHERRVFAEAGYQLGQESLWDCHRELAPLAVQLQHRHGQSASVEATERLLASQANHLDGVVFTCRLGRNLVAFALAYPWHDALYVRMAGFDYPRLVGAFEYFNLTTYLPIDYAYRNGLREIHLGMESYRGKLLRRAELEPLVTVFAAGSVPDPDRLRAMAWQRVRTWEDQVPDPAGLFRPRGG
ncbi:GNAT family N-acetyltransferase [Streptantibioticus rubrisoli]|uniref:GNAT family N-acetyltransferase n=1 Tax=Streptantibioticus rubrisoli TaxID=1387313 RepID=A0ABT1P8Z4_9ACTN|nr:GNAT family N-acetyltransferase [Streptantibioticus rubrisoli]MCQ4041843.1 GNAT family N-acetyltransferase [Streptantibioticus rubrisoli]